MLSRDEIISRFPTTMLLTEMGHAAVKKGGELYYTCPLHHDTKPSLRVKESNQLWYCDVCDKGGSSIDLFAAVNGITPRRAMEQLSERIEVKPVEPIPTQVLGEIEAVYTYVDENGKNLFDVVRYAGKQFRQRRYLADGTTAFGLNGTRRVLYKLPEVLEAEKDVLLVEGEKDVENLGQLGFCATCNPHGAGKWLDSYSDYLKGKSVVIVPDNDEPGRKHAQAVASALMATAESVRILQVPAPHKDISDWIASFNGDGMAAHQTIVRAVVQDAKAVRPEHDVPLKAMGECERDYLEYTSHNSLVSYSFGGWLPKMGIIRPLVPGDLVVVIADTGVGKSAFLQNMVVEAAPLPTLFFELELPGSLMFERFISIERRIGGVEIERRYREGETGMWRGAPKLSHFLICDLPNVGPDEIEKIIQKADLRLGTKPALVVVDYMQLLSGKGGSRYERASYAAERLKQIAKATNTIVVVASQMHRPPRDETGEERSAKPSLHSAKDSGSIENSAGLVLGLHRPRGTTSELQLSVLKCTKGGAGLTVDLRFDTDSLRIDEAITNPQWEAEAAALAQAHAVEEDEP